MINEEALKKIKLLEDQYKRTWGREVDYTGMPNSITQEELALTLERIVDTNESISVGYGKIKEQLGKK